MKKKRKRIKDERIQPNKNLPVANEYHDYRSYFVEMFDDLFLQSFYAY